MESPKSLLAERTNNWMKNSITIRLVTIGILILLLLIPVSMVEDLIREREYRQEDAISEVSNKWGREQTITGLVLTIPYSAFSKVYDKEDNGKYKMVKTTEYAHFLPDDLHLAGEVTPEMRYRGIYEVIVYNAAMELNGCFKRPDFSEWKIAEEHIAWEDAFISLGLTDLRSIQQDVAVQWNGKAYAFNPGLETNDVIASGISARIPLEAMRTDSVEINFSLPLVFNGSSSLQFTPLGKTTDVAIRSTWQDPSFEGAFLPDTREVGKDGFQAHWHVLHLNRPFPQQFRGSVNNISDAAFGVSLIVPVDEYQKSMRSAKYAAMFITLTFLIFFFVQVLNGIRIHPIQYIIVGLALCVFYTLLIAISEHISFQYSYLISSIAIVTLITLYAGSIFKQLRITAITALILALLYTFIYSIIQLQDYALLMGSIGLFVVLALIMYLSRKIDWYAVKGGEQR